MASLRQTRPFSQAIAHSAASYYEDSYYDTPSRGSDARLSFNTPDLHGQSNVGNEGHVKSLRKAKSSSSVKSVQFDDSRGHVGTGTGTGIASPSLARGPLVSGNSGGYESGERIKKQGKGRRSQSARPRDHTRNDDQPLTSNHAHRQSSHHTRISKHDPRKSGNRSRSPSIVAPGSSAMHTENMDEKSSSECYIGDSYKLKSDFGDPSRTQFNSQGAVGDILEEVSMQKRQRSKLRAPRSRTASPAPLSAFPLQSYAPHASLARRSSASPLPIHSREATYNTPDSDAISGLPLMAKSQSRMPQVSSSYASSPPPLSMAPRTLKDVTRYLGQNRGTSQRHHSSSDSDSRYDGLLDDSKSSCSLIFSLSHNPHVELDSSMKVDTTEHHIYKDTHHRASHKPRYGLALTSESGHVIGERPVTDIRTQLPPKRAVTSDKSIRSIPTLASKSRKTPLASSSESSSESNIVCTQGNLGRPGPPLGSTNTARGSTDRRHVIEKDTVHAPHILPNVPSRSQRDVVDRRQLLSRRQEDKEQHPYSHRQGSAPSPVQTPSLPSSLPRHSDHPIFAKTPPIPTRSGIPALLRSKPSRLQSSISHPPSGSDTSVHSLPRLGKLVICNPDLAELPSPLPSSDHETPMSAVAAASRDFSVLALSASQASVDSPVGSGDYIVPDEVAVAVTNHEERRRRALAGLVDGLSLVKGDQATDVAADDPLASVPRTPWNQSPDQELDGEDDDAFFSRLSGHDEEDSLLEEPEPEIGYTNDEDYGFDGEAFGSPYESDTEDEEQRGEHEDDDEYENERRLPPTPKFVHPLTDGDDLESRITRVASLHRISTTPLPSQFHKQERDSPGRLEVEPWNEWSSSPTWKENRSRKHMEGGATQKTSTVGSRHPQTTRAVDGTERSSKENASISDSRESYHHPSSVTGKNVGILSNIRSLSSNLLTDTELSSIGDGRLSEPGSGTEETLSSGAEALFKQLQVEADTQPNPCLGDDRTESYPDWRNKSPFHEDMSSRNTGSAPRPIEPNALRTWRSTLPFGAFDSLSERHGPLEMRRQEIIWELCETELAFVKSLRLILRLFVQPLRHEDKTWIAGIPRDVTRLFDWFDDIMHLHSQISSALHAVRSAQYPVVFQVAETLRPFVPRLELHQPYLVRLESVTSAVEAMSKDMLSDFGEFVRIQTASPECESMNLSSFLLKPVQRLMKYPLFFKRLWEFTPRNHPDHLATFSLLHSTDIIIRVMQEVKAREEEYELVKNLASRIKGLPSDFQLARRERRLVAQGLLRRIYLTDKECHALDSSLDFSPSGNSKSPLRRMTSVSSSDTSSFAGDWSYHPVVRGENLPSSETDRSLRADSPSSDMTLDSRLSMSRATTPSRSRSSSMRSALRQKVKECSVYAFVFTDLIILTTPMSEKLHLLRSPKNVTEAKESWKLVEDVGVSRVLGVTDQSGQLTSYDHLITVEMMSVTSKALNTGIFSNSTSAIPVYLGIPDQKQSTADGASQALSEAKAKWLHAFDRCFRFTIRSLSFPSYTGNTFGNGGNIDLDSDTKSSVISILASGLPLPMSPSQQLDEAQKGRPADLVQEEREERGWWSLRFQQVLKELQRGSRSPILDAGLVQTRSRPQGAKRFETRPLILSPNPSSAVSRKGSILSLGRKRNK